MNRVVQSAIKLTQDKLKVRFSVYVVWLSVLNLNNLEVHKIQKSTEKILYTSVNFINPGLMLTGFHVIRQ